MSRAREMSIPDRKRYDNLSNNYGTKKDRPVSVQKQQLKKSYLVEDYSIQQQNPQPLKDYGNTYTQRPNHSMINYPAKYSSAIRSRERQRQRFANYNRGEINIQANDIKNLRAQKWQKPETFGLPLQNHHSHILQNSNNNFTALTKMSSANNFKSNRPIQDNYPRNKYFETQNSYRGEYTKNSKQIIGNIDRVQQKIKNLLGNR